MLETSLAAYLTTSSITGTCEAKALISRIAGPSITASAFSSRALASQVPVIDDVVRYAAKLVSNTHPELNNSCATAKKYVKYGASPRAAQALITCAKVRALINGNYNVSFEDVAELARAVLRHRIKINYTAVNDKLTVDNVIDMIVKETHL